MPTININTLSDNTKIYVTGIVDFCRIIKHIEGEELKLDNARKLQNNMQPEDKPHTRLTISQAAVVYANPAEPTLAEQYIAEKFYISKKNPEKNKCFTGKNKSRNLPEIYQRNLADPMQVETVLATSELAQGLRVTLVLRVFKTKQNNGLSLDAVIADEPIRFAIIGGTNSASALVERGFTVLPASPETVAAYQAQLTANASAGVMQNTQPTAPQNTNYAAPQYVAPAPQYVAPQTPAPQYVAPQTPAPQYVAPQTPAPQTAPQVNNYGLPAGNPQAQTNTQSQLPVPPIGYQYDANNQLIPVGIKLP